MIWHTGIITNYKDIKKFLENKGNKFESETDTEIIAKLIKHIYSQHPSYSFRELVEQVIQQLVILSSIRIVDAFEMAINYLFLKFE